MNDYLLLMHRDATDLQLADDAGRWEQYLTQLRGTGLFDGGSAIGGGEEHKKHASIQPARSRLDGFIRVRAESLESARQFLTGNPVYEAGGTVEIRELPKG